MNYTKGKWQVAKFDSSLVQVRIEVSGEEDVFPIAEVAGTTSLEVEANAHLISAAPDNYERLKTTTWLLEQFLEGHTLDKSNLQKVVTENNKALAKAEGKQ